MKLYEFEGHNILAKAGIASSFFVVADDLESVKQARKRLKFPIVAKIQVLSGRRGKSGGVKICVTEKQLLDFAKDKFGNSFNGEKVGFLMLAEKVDIARELYISITYDTVLKTPFLLFSEHGGVNIEEVERENPDAIVRVNIDPNEGPSKKELKKYKIPEEFAIRLWDAFWRFDCRLVEVNPLAAVRKSTEVHSRSVSEEKARSHSGSETGFVAIDAKVILDDSGLLRHKDLDVIPKGAISSVPTERELLARMIDSEDYRGSAGSTFLELSGDIAILASGGGASLLVMDSVVSAGGKPANYTEYSGNPPAEKVRELTKITLLREGISGCLVAGAVANFTDIFETLSGFIDGLRQVKPKPMYPIVIRRGGPRQKEAFEMIKKAAEKEGYDIHLYGPETPISVACRKMVELSNKYKSQVTSYKS